MPEELTFGYSGGHTAESEKNMVRETIISCKWNTICICRKNMEYFPSTVCRWILLFMIVIYSDQQQWNANGHVHAWTGPSPSTIFNFILYFDIFFFFAVDLFRILTAAKHSRTMCLHEYWYGIKWITAYVGVGEAQFNWTVPIWSISLSLSSGGEFVSMEYNIAFVNVQALSNVSALPMRRIIYILCVCVRAHSPLRER